MHELKLIVDLMYRGGLSYMRYSISDTAEHGDYTGGARLVTDETRKEMGQMLEEIQLGRLRQELDRGERGRPALVRQAAQGGAVAAHRGGRARKLRAHDPVPRLRDGHPRGRREVGRGGEGAGEGEGGVRPVAGRADTFFVG